MAFLPNSNTPDTGSIPSSIFTSRYIATIEFVHNQSTLYQFSASSHTTDPFYQIYPELRAGTCTGAGNSGQYAACAWGVSRIIDGIEIAAANSTPANPFPIVVKCIAVIGCSYAGKMALYAGALDKRVALIITQESGVGGLPSWRVSHAIEPAG